MHIFHAYVEIVRKENWTAHELYSGAKCDAKQNLNIDFRKNDISIFIANKTLSMLIDMSIKKTIDSSFNYQDDSFIIYKISCSNRLAANFSC